MTVPVIRCEKCGQGMGRSYQQLKRLMKLRSVAYKHWPHDHYFQPDSEEHLRAWLIVKAGFAITKEIPLGEALLSPKQQDGLEILLRATLQAAGAHAFVDLDWRRIIVRSPVSLSYATSHKVATEICSAIDEVIYAELGITAETLLREAEKAA